MGKRIYLSESQFKDIMRKALHEGTGNEGTFLDYDDVIKLLHEVVDNDFYCFFSNGKVYGCSAIHEKGEIFYDICTGHPKLMPNDRIMLHNDRYGNYEIENLLNNGED